MTVQYLQDYVDESVAPGFIFKKGWTAKHADPEGESRIENGICIQVDDDVRARRSTEMTRQCAGQRMNDAKNGVEKAKQTTNTKISNNGNYRHSISKKHGALHRGR